MLTSNFSELYNPFYLGFADLLTVLLYVLLSCFLSFNLRKHKRFFSVLFLYLALVHSLLTLSYFWISLTDSSDATMYYFSTLDYNGSWLEFFGTDFRFIRFLVHPLIHVFGLSYFGTYFVFAAIGLVGYYLLLSLLLHFIKRYSIVYKASYFYLLLLPGLHFFTCAIGKDSLIFFSIIAVLYGVIKKNYILLSIGLIIIGYVRIHILMALLIGYFISAIFLNRKLSPFKKYSLAILLSAVMIIIMPYAVEKVGIETLSVEGIGEFITEQNTAFDDSGSAVNLAGALFPLKVVSYLFRPFFFDARNIMALISSFENILWIYMIWMSSKKLLFNLNKASFSSIYAQLLGCFIVLLFMLSSTINNLGIAFRQKTMLFPFIFLLFFFSQSTYWNIKLKRLRGLD